MALVIFDTNIIIDALKGYKPALDEPEYWDEPAISAITWMEVVAGTKPEEEGEVMGFLDDFGFEIIHTDADIMFAAAKIRKLSIRSGAKIPLPDAIIQGTAVVKNALIVTRNKKDFRGAGIRIPYEVTSTQRLTFSNVVPPPGPAPHI